MASLPPPSLLGQMAGEYRLLRHIGEGGFGTVYEAEHPVLRRRAAVKVLHQASGRDSEAVKRFIAEAQVVSQIKSPHVVDIFSFGTLPDGRHFFVMDLLQGEPLDRYLEHEGRLDVATTIKLMQPIAETLDRAHSAGIVHRDLKPQNIFLAWDPSGRVVPKLLDFGLVKLLDQPTVHTASGTPMGTPLYMSPEQALGADIDGRSDVYGLGVLCYELLSGKLPLSGETTVGVLMAHISQPPPPLSRACRELPEALDAPIAHMLEKNRDARPASASGAIADLRRAAERSGYVIDDNLPSLHLPPPVPASLDSSEPAPAASVNSDEFEPARQTMVRSAQPSGKRSVSWPSALLLLLLAVGATLLIVRELGSSSPAASGPNKPSELGPSARPSPPPLPPVPAARPAGSATHHDVAITIVGAPAGARIVHDGNVLEDIGGAVRLPFGMTPVKLVISAAGYEPVSVAVTPDHAQTVAVKPQKSAARSVRKPAIPRDLENPF